MTIKTMGSIDDHLPFRKTTYWSSVMIPVTTIATNFDDKGAFPQIFARPTKHLTRFKGLNC